ncbi:hypothetical protein E2C01_056526 [Portunus trituberculatus]|uniref:Uncharacterized protein n=1 Tax=Portunus trituberculatus TaxID=210409 RepID=A0A5B7GQK1_PORTR|nr:hypothetical protein [Portunus trituberculatus]
MKLGALQRLRQFFSPLQLLTPSSGGFSHASLLDRIE